MTRSACEPRSPRAATAQPLVDDPNGDPNGRRRLPLEASALALMASSVSTALLGLVFWAVTARGYPAGEVGRAAAAISTATALATISNLSLHNMYERFLGLTRARTVPLILQGQLLCGGIALVLGAGFVWLGPRAKLFDTTVELVTFPLLVAVLSAFALQDPIMVGLRSAPLVAAKNIFHSVAKLALVAALAVRASGTSIVGAWLGPALVAVLAVNGWLVARVRPRTIGSGPPILPPRPELLQFFGASYAMTMIAVVVPLSLPLIVVYKFGAEMNAYFATSWTLASAAAMLISTVAGPFVAEASADPDLRELPRLTKRFVRMLAVIGIGGGIALYVTAPLLLGFFGPAYVREGLEVTRLMAATMPLIAISTFFLALSRVLRRLRLAVAIQPLTIAGVLGGSLLLSDRLGLPGIGLAYLLSETVCVLVIALPLVRMYRQATAG